MKKLLSFLERCGRRWFAGVLAAALLAAGLGGCGVGPEAVPPQPEAQDAPSVPSALPPDGELGYHLLCALPNLNSQNLTLMARGIQDYCDNLGINVTMHNSHGDHLAQAVEIDAFVAGGGQAILCQPVDAAALQPFLQVARQQGAFVVTWGENADADASLSVDYRDAGYALAKDAAVWAKGQDGRRPNAVLLISGASVLGFAAGVADGYSSSFPDEGVQIQTLAVRDDTLAEDLLNLDPSPTIIMADSDEAVILAREKLAAYWAAQAEEDEPAEEPDWNQYYFGGFGATREGLDALQAGTLDATVSENGYVAGKTMVDMAVALLQGGTAEGQTIDPVLVDKANMAGYN